MEDSPDPNTLPDGVNPEYAHGELKSVAVAQNQPEAEFIQNLLLAEGVPSLVQRNGGADVPDFLAAGVRDILVPASGVEAAREILLQTESTEESEGD